MRCLGVLLVAVAVTSCGSDPRVCGAVGAPPPGVAFDVAELSGLSAPVRLTVCAADTCRALPTVPEDSFGVVVDPRVHRDGDVPVSLLVERGDRVLLRAEGTAHLRLAQPNGPGCDPRQWSGNVRLTGGRLVPTSR